MCMVPDVLGVVVVSHFQCLNSSSASLDLATEITGALSSLHQLNGRVVDAGIKEERVHLEARNGQCSLVAVLCWIGSVVV